jgi:hypothetical protein
MIFIFIFFFLIYNSYSPFQHAASISPPQNIFRKAGLFGAVLFVLLVSCLPLCMIDRTEETDEEVDDPIRVGTDDHPLYRASFVITAILVAYFWSNFGLFLIDLGGGFVEPIYSSLLEERGDGNGGVIFKLVSLIYYFCSNFSASDPSLPSHSLSLRRVFLYASFISQLIILVRAPIGTINHAGGGGNSFVMHVGSLFNSRWTLGRHYRKDIGRRSGTTTSTVSAPSVRRSKNISQQASSRPSSSTPSSGGFLSTLGSLFSGNKRMQKYKQESEEYYKKVFFFF